MCLRVQPAGFVAVGLVSCDSGRISQSVAAQQGVFYSKASSPGRRLHKVTEVVCFNSVPFSFFNSSVVVQSCNAV